MHKLVNKPEHLSWLVLSGVLIACCCAFLIPAKVQAASTDDDADDNSIQLGSTTVIQYKVDSNFKVRGWKLSPEVYFGNAKVNGQWGFGLLVDKGGYVYGLNNTQASFMWRF